MIKNKKKTTGIILCGGKSSRMGKNKALLTLNGKFIIRYVIDVLNEFCDNLLISTNTDELNFLNIETVADEYKNIGPIAGILSALKKSSTEQNIILSCDTPFITREFIAYMLRETNTYDVLLPVFNDHLQPMTGIFNKRLIPHIEQEISEGNYIPPRIFEKSKLKKLRVNENTSGWHQHLFFNINSPEDYDLARKIIL